MHYECELAVVIGRTAKRVRAANAMDYVVGYTVSNDYAVRDYLENFYRPNLRVKNRDAYTAIGPWLVDADDVPDPHALGLRTRVNGEVTQDGSTSDMIHRVDALVSYISQWVTLDPGDVILTGTPAGVGKGMKPPRFLKDGDTVTVTIDGIGTLTNPCKTTP